MSPIYRHTQSQPGLVWFYAAFFSAVLLLLTVTGEANATNAALILPPFGVFGLVVAFLSRLTVEVTEEELRLEFGLGLGRARFPRAGMVVLGELPVGPLAGIGIRLLPDGWLYRIAGGDALVTRLGNGRRLLIGTDDPGGLWQALR